MSDVLEQTTPGLEADNAIDTGHDAALASLKSFTGGEPEPQAEAPVVPQADTPAIDESLMFDVKRCGFDQDDIEGLSRDRVEKMVRAYDRAVANSAWNPPQQQNNGQTQQEPPGFLPPVRPFDFKFDPATTDAETQSILQAQNKYFADTMNQVVGTVNQKLYEHQQSLETMQALDTVRSFDGFLTALGPEWKDIVGEGATLEMNEKSAAFGKRAAILKTYNGLKRDAAMRGQHVSDNELFRRAWGAECMDQIRSKERARVNGAVAGRQKQFVQRPGERTPAPSKESVRESALKGLKQAFASGM